MSKRTCYIAGPMRGYVSFNFPAFRIAGQLLTAMCWDVISPAKLDVEHKEPWTRAGDFDWADTNYPITPQDCRRCIRRDLDILLGLRRERGDAVILLPGWRKSTGAWAEASVAQWAMLPLWEFSIIGATANLYPLTAGEWGAKEVDAV